MRNDVFEGQKGVFRSRIPNSVSVDKSKCNKSKCNFFSCSDPRTTSDYAEPRSHESFVMNSCNAKQLFPRPRHQ